MNQEEEKEIINKTNRSSQANIEDPKIIELQMVGMELLTKRDNLIQENNALESILLEYEDYIDSLKQSQANFDFKHSQEYITDLDFRDYYDKNVETLIQTSTLNIALKEELAKCKQKMEEDKKIIKLQDQKIASLGQNHSSQIELLDQALQRVGELKQQIVLLNKKIFSLEQQNNKEKSKQLNNQYIAYQKPQNLQHKPKQRESRQQESSVNQNQPAVDNASIWCNVL